MFSNSFTLLFKNRLTQIILGLVGAIVLIEFSLSMLMPENRTTRQMDAKIEMVRQRPAPDVAIMGDSVVDSCLKAPVLRDRLRQLPGLEEVVVDNYSVPGSSPISIYYQLEKQLKAGRKPGLILYAPNSATITTPVLERFFSRQAEWNDWGKSLTLGVAPQEALYGWLFKLSFTLRYREELREVLTQGDLEFLETLKNEPVILKNVRETPFEKPEPLDPNLQHQREVPPILQQPFVASPVVQKHLEAFFALAAKNEIPIVFLSPPIPEEVASIHRESGSEAEYQKFLQWLDSFENVTVLEEERVVYPDGYFPDLWHTAPYAAWLFSQEAANRLQEFLVKHPEIRARLESGVQ